MSLVGLDLEFGSSSGTDYPVQVSTFTNSHGDQVVGITTKGIEAGVVIPVSDWDEVCDAVAMLLRQGEEE